MKKRLAVTFRKKQLVGELPILVTEYYNIDETKSDLRFAWELIKDRIEKMIAEKDVESPMTIELEKE